MWYLITAMLTGVASTLMSNNVITNRSLINIHSSKQEAIFAIGNKFASNCFWLLLDSNHNFQPALSNVEQSNASYILVDQAMFVRLEQWETFISSGGFKEKTCVVVVIFELPSAEILAKLDMLMYKKIDKFIIFTASDIIESSNLLLDSRLINEMNVASIVEDSKSNWMIFVRQLYTPEKVAKVVKINKWNKNFGFEEKDNVFFDQTADFKGNTLRGSTLNFMPFTAYDIVANDQPIIPTGGLDFLILKTVAYALNFNYNMYIPLDGLWGIIGHDGTWQGVVGDIAKRRANFSLVLSVLESRFKSVDYAQVYFNDPIAFVTSTKRPSANWQKIIIPFQGEVWAVTVMTIVLSCVVYYPMLKRKEDMKFIYVNPSRSVVQMVGSFLSQNLPYTPKNAFGRFFLSIWLIYSLLLTTYYKTSLMAVLAVPPVAPTLDALEELYNSDLEYGMIKAKGSEFSMFSSSTVEIHKKVFKEMLFLTSEESMKRVDEGKHAYIYFKSNLESIVASKYTDKNGQTNMHISREVYFPGIYAWAFPKGSPYVKSFDKVFGRIIQAGMINNWLKEIKRLTVIEGLKNRDEKESTPADSDSTLVVLSVSHLQGAFAALLLGYCMAFVLFLLEIICNKAKMLIFHQVWPAEDNEANTTRLFLPTNKILRKGNDAIIVP